MTLVDTDSRLDLDVSTTEPTHAHIVDRGDDPRTANAIVLEARIYGTPVTALCGVSWVPSRDPMKLPLCKECERMFPFAMSYRLG